MGDSTEWIVEWWKHTGLSKDDAMVIEENNEEKVLTDAENEKPWRYDEGKGPENMSPDEPNSQTDTLWAMSDGGVTNAGTHCTRAGYGYTLSDQMNRWKHGEILLIHCQEEAWWKVIICTWTQHGRKLEVY